MSVPGGSAVFTCLSSFHDDSIVDIQWLLDGLPIDQAISGSSVSVNIEFSEEFNIGRLALDNLSMDFNGAVIHCMAIFTFESPIASYGAILLIQGVWAVCHVF